MQPTQTNPDQPASGGPARIGARDFYKVLGVIETGIEKVLGTLYTSHFCESSDTLQSSHGAAPTH